MSSTLIRNETWLLLPALSIDIRSQKFRKMGVPIVCDDFIDMRLIKPKETKPPHESTANRSVFVSLQGALQSK